MKLLRKIIIPPGVVSALLGLPALIVGVWALVQGTSYFSIAILPTIGTSVIILSALLIIVGVVMLLGGIAYILFLRFSGAHEDSVQCLRVFFLCNPFFTPCLL